MEGHAVHDDAFYVPKPMLEEWAKADPIERFRTWLRENVDFSDEEEDEIKAGVKRLLNEALQRAEESPLPDPSELTRRRLRDARGPRHAAPQVDGREDLPPGDSATASARRCAATSACS